MTDAEAEADGSGTAGDPGGSGAVHDTTRQTRTFGGVTRTAGTFRGAARAVTPVVGKALEAGIVVLYIGLLTAVLYGGVVPDYRTAAGAAVGDRALATAADRIEAAVPPNATAVESEVRVDLPTSIRGGAYRVKAVNDTALVLDHPVGAVSGRTDLVVPPAVGSVNGSWSSGSPNAVVVRGGPDGLRVRLEDRRT